MVDKCPEWELELNDLLVTIDAGPERLALSVALALSFVSRKQGMACLVFPGCPRRGFLHVAGPAGAAELYFFAFPDELPQFWRSLFRLENVPEAEFFALAERSFPKLIFHPDLNFGRFRGPYRERRDFVVAHLSALNDEFLDAHQASLGKASEVEIRLRHVGWHGVSPESTKTHANAAAMRKRYVRYNGQDVCCEWHTKIMPTYDRIHFAFGGVLGDRILIGIFVAHLDV
ncbi:MAG TPA: hypothetical protein VF069_28180, partial [Streptosporangiaceae bacterium]